MEIDQNLSVAAEFLIHLLFPNEICKCNDYMSKLCTTYHDRCVCAKSYSLLNPSRRTTSTEYYSL